MKQQRPVGMTWVPSASDASKYAIDGPQTLSGDDLDSRPSSELEAIETELRAHTDLVLEDVWIPFRRDVVVSRALMWVTLKLAGSGLAWGDFNPQVRCTKFNFIMEDVDVSPPAETPDGDSSPAAAE